MAKVIDTPGRNVFVTIVIHRLPLNQGFVVRVSLLGEGGEGAIARRPLLLEVARDLARLGLSMGITERALNQLKKDGEFFLEEVLIERSRMETFRSSVR